ncbi:hypothetical protein FHS18_004294 [Paenibacillus phyllosphaerae]|uniref:Copper amine oxidase-like N-terminal domain-containing protein n=1 Tax=Paenibacillus phyllosphaerae TaxID=274593 RepID=A0A7W5B0P6_9BACL|nr:copper amine oxidase N-terminal domain-containing protein [Paenibacillus phyllosphaerae]MBB3112208.1 hypothetical protein [Paenibacillus phyllosphaerae]
MKRILTILLAAILLMIGAVPAALAAPAAISLFINGEQIQDNGIKPVTDAKGIYLPYKPVFAKLGYAVAYDPKARLIVLTKTGIKIAFAPGKNTALVNGVKTALTVAPRTIGSTVYVPLSFLREAAHVPATYERATGAIRIGQAEDKFLPPVQFGMTVDEVKQLMSTEPTGELEEEGRQHLVNYWLQIPNGRKGSYTFTFENGKLVQISVAYMETSWNYDASIQTYKQDKAYLEQLYNNGKNATDTYWNTSPEEALEYLEEYGTSNGTIYKDAISYGFMDLAATYEQPSFSVGIRFANANWDEPGDPFYFEMITYTKK